MVDCSHARFTLNLRRSRAFNKVVSWALSNVFKSVVRAIISFFITHSHYLYIKKNNGAKNGTNFNFYITNQLQVDLKNNTIRKSICKCIIMFIPWNICDTFLWLKSWLPQNDSLKAESYTARRATNTELLMLVLNLMVNVRLKER